MNWQLEFIPNKATDHVDVTLAAMGCVLVILSVIYLQIVLHNPVYIAVGVVVLIGCVACLLLRRRSTAAARAQVEATTQTYLLANILFFCLLTYSIRVESLTRGIHTLRGHYDS